jgi:cob(I)alamin adenosyltransferase
MKKSTIYTATGDKGATGLIGGTRIAKDDAQLEAYGTVDELNAQVGLLRTYLTDRHDLDMLLSIQNLLFVVGSILATDTATINPDTIGKITEENVKSLENEIDLIDGQLSHPKLFVIPGGCRGAAIAHICRTVCRRAERRIYAFRDEKHPVNEYLLKYMNRLSDYFFLLSRKINISQKSDEIFWNNPCI